MPFCKKNLKKDAFEDYLNHLSKGKPSSSWCIKDSKEELHLTCNNLQVFCGYYYTHEKVRVAKSMGISCRHQRFLDLMEDPKTALPKLAVLKCVEEIFFSEGPQERADSSFLMEKLNEALKTDEDIANP